MSGSTGGTTVGSGSDQIVLNISEDSAAGADAQFTVNVDGQQVGGLQTATAAKSAGQDQTFTVDGNYGVGQHTVTVTFANNFLLPGQSGDRNLYVDGVTYDGQTVSNTTTGVYQSPIFPPNSTSDIDGNAVYTVNDTTPVPSGAADTPTTTPGAVSVGSGADTLTLNMAEDAYQGDAQFTISVDGQQIGGTQTTTASVAQGQQQEFDVHGDFGSGTHTVSVDYTNDQIGAFYAGTQLAVDTTDRNLYVMGVSLDGGPAASGTPYELSTDGSQSFSVTAGSGASSTSTSTATTPVAAATTSSDDTGSSSDNATITSSSLSSGQTQSGSSSGMSFVAPATSSGTSSGATTTSGSDSSGSGSMTTDTTPSVAASLTSQSQSMPDVAVASATGSTDSTGSTTVSSGGHWWMNHQSGGGDAGSFHHHG